MSHHTASTPPCPVEQPSLSVADQLSAFFQALLLPPPDETSQQKRPGRPALLAAEHLWLAMFLSVLHGHLSFADVWRRLTWEGGLGSFPLLNLTRDGVRKRLLRLGLDSLQSLLLRVNQALLSWTRPFQEKTLAPFASQVVALDESTLDMVRRLCEDVRDELTGSPRLLVGKLAGLFDLRRQQWVRLQFREDALANCKWDVFSLLTGLPKGALILADLGYFSFSWFDWLSGQGYLWISRLREKTTYVVKHTYIEQKQGQVFDGLVWLGQHRMDRAGCLVRLIQFQHQGVLYEYITNVLDPQLLSIHEVAQLYARRWDIELSFKLLKKELGIAFWWSSHPTLVLQQLWIALILAQVLHALHLRIAAEAGVQLFDVSLPVLVKLLKQAPRQAPQPGQEESFLSLLLCRGRLLGLLRPSRRIPISTPVIEQPSTPLPKDMQFVRKERYAHHKCGPRSDRELFQPRFHTCWMI